METVLVVAAVFIGVVSGASWNYDTSSSYGPAGWNSVNANCGGKSQSPIDIVTENAKADENLGFFDRSLFANKFTGLTMSNNGHSLVIKIDSGAYTLTDDGLFEDDYTLEQFHFHWGSSTTNPGSEHTLNGKRYFAEMHLVHYNTKYSSVSDAVNKPNGLAVLGFFIDTNYQQDNLAFQRLLDWVINTEYINDAHTFASANLFSIETILPVDLSMYYRYQGSLTTPSCDETVVWTVFKEPLQISAGQADLLANSMYTGSATIAADIMNNNYRPIQNLNGRSVTRPLEFKQQSCSSQSLMNIIFAMAMANQKPSQYNMGFGQPAYFDVGQQQGVFMDNPQQTDTHMDQAHSDM